MVLSNLKNKRIVLASKSPRRQQLLKGLDVPFEVRTLDVDESFPPALQREEIPVFLSKVKAQAFRENMADDEVIITADTIVWVNDHVLNKPSSKEEALEMIQELSDNVHTVYTSVTVMSKDKTTTFVDETEVVFGVLSELEIAYYIDRYEPFDKAGAYGVQEFIGYIGIKELRGSYFNVMGLPVHRLYEILKEY